MPAKEIKELRQAGKLEEALILAKAELQLEPDNIWPKRNISWVYYDYLKQHTSSEQFDSFIIWLNEIKTLQLPLDEKMLFEQLAWQVGKMAFGLIKVIPIDHDKGIRLFEAINTFHFPKPSEGYSFLFKALHKLLKETNYYIKFADWWNFENFMPEDFQKEQMPNGREVMAIAEQAYIAYAKHLLPIQNQFAESNFDREKAQAFVLVLENIVDQYPQFQYPPYFLAKLLLALGDKEHMLSALLPFAKKKQNDFWVWMILAEALAFSPEPDQVFACYCKALSCKSPEEMLVSLRQKMARLFIDRKLYNEARLEIDLLVHARRAHGFKIPAEVTNWQAMDWYKAALSLKSNFDFYKTYFPIAEAILFCDVSEETAIVEFVNTDRKILNFIASENKYGFFKYDRFFKNIAIGDTIKIRIQGGSNGGCFQIYTAIKVKDEDFRNNFLIDVSGVVKIPTGKSFGFLDDVFIHPALVKKNMLADGMKFSGKAIRIYNTDKRQWGWKLI
ncbi:DUF7017 domain-containing protein [Sediminibacterium sp.]|uniref:DUF7017 domain-containing protein n=1 Tax=Sediminibacterium sp. TaxID=1917865 RepID=UPI003F71C9A6